MWEAKINCERCGATHSVHSTLESMPRAFAYECPAENERVEIRFRDPSVMTESWAEVDGATRGSLPTLADQVGGSFDL